MSEEQVQAIRKSNHDLITRSRRKLRDQESDMKRSLENLRISKYSVVDIANKLKTKSQITASELQILKNVLIDDISNNNIVLSTNGAIRSLVRELSGNNIIKQCAAAGCFCNLALADSRASMMITKHAGPYLITALDNFTSELAVTCAWTVGNLAGSGVSICELLIAQGALAKLTEMMSINNEDISEASNYALLLLTYKMRDCLKLEHLERILEVLYQMEIRKSTVQLLFILSCHKEFPSRVPERYLEILLEATAVSVLHCNNVDMKLTYLFRCLANMDVSKIYNKVLDYFLKQNMCDSLKELLKCKRIEKSLLWLLGNMFNYCSDHLFFTKFLT